MGRPVEFDQQKVIDNIVGLFWERGYEGTSMKNISDATGLQPGSLYAAFGNKRALFLTAIDSYFKASIENLKALLEADGSPLQRVHEMFMYIVGDTCHKDSRGCMLVNALLETSADDKELKNRIANMFQELEQAIKKVLIEAASSGELGSGKDPANQAKLLINNIYGLRVYGKLQLKDSIMKQMVDDLMVSLKSG